MTSLGPRLLERAADEPCVVRSAMVFETEVPVRGCERESAGWESAGFSTNIVVVALKGALGIFVAFRRQDEYRVARSTIVETRKAVLVGHP
jgi:hypothetical protein